MPIELHENQESIPLNTIRRLYRWNSCFTLKKLIQKTHSDEMAQVFRYLSSSERRDIFQFLLILLMFPVVFLLPQPFFRPR